MSEVRSNGRGNYMRRTDMTHEDYDAASFLGNLKAPLQQIVNPLQDTNASNFGQGVIGQNLLLPPHPNMSPFDRSAEPSHAIQPLALVFASLCAEVNGDITRHHSLSAMARCLGTIYPTPSTGGFFRSLLYCGGFTFNVSFVTAACSDRTLTFSPTASHNNPWTALPFCPKPSTATDPNPFTSPSSGTFCFTFVQNHCCNNRI